MPSSAFASHPRDREPGGAVALLNAHTHLELSGLSELLPSVPETMAPWLARVGRSMAGLDRRALSEATETGIAALRAAGIGSVCDITSTGASIDPLLASGLEGIVFLEIRGIGRREAVEALERAQSTIAEARKAARRSTMRVGLALHSPYECHPELMANAAKWCRSESIPLSIHVAESTHETSWVRYARAVVAIQRTPIPSVAVLPASRLLATLLRDIGTVTYLDRLGVLEARPLLAHCVQVSDAEIRRLAQTDCSVVHCPRSNARLSCGRMPLERFLEAGVRVHLGTDGLASSPTLDVRDEIAFATDLHCGRVDPDAIKALAKVPLAI